MAAGAISFYFITLLKVRGPTYFGLVDGSWYATTFAAGISLSASAFIVAINLAIKTFVYAATRRERHVSTTRFERSLFAKLSIAYVANTVALPWLIGAIPFGLSQAWYEAGGPVEQAQALLLTGTIFEELYKLSQPIALFQRHCLGQRAASQLRLNMLWAPPLMLQGELFACVIKQMSLVLLYAPLYPPFYLLGAFALLVSLISNKASLSFWWGRPPWVGAELMERFRTWLELLLPMHFVTAAVGLRASNPLTTHATPAHATPSLTCTRGIPVTPVGCEPILRPDATVRAEMDERGLSTAARLRWPLAGAAAAALPRLHSLPRGLRTRHHVQGLPLVHCTLRRARANLRWHSLRRRAQGEGVRVLEVQGPRGHQGRRGHKRVEL